MKRIFVFVCKYFRSHYKAMIFAVALFLFFIFVFGFRITYAPHLVNDWEAISACASWAAAIISGAAIIVAVQIPKKIAEQQNKIELFERRIIFYRLLTECISFSEIILNSSSNREVCIIFVNLFEKKDDLVNYRADLNGELDIEREALLVAYNVSHTLLQGLYIFEANTKEYVSGITKNLIGMLLCTQNKELFDEHYMAYIEATRVAKESFVPLVEKELTLYK